MLFFSRFWTIAAKNQGFFLVRFDWDLDGGRAAGPLCLAELVAAMSRVTRPRATTWTSFAPVFRPPQTGPVSPLRPVFY